MKKLLSLLNVLTISSSVIPTTIAASPYQKENNNNNLRKKMELDSNNQKENNNKTTSSHKNKNTLWKNISIFSRTIKKTTDEIKNYFYQKENNNIKTNKLKKITNLDSNRSKRSNFNKLENKSSSYLTIKISNLTWKNIINKKNIINEQEFKNWLFSLLWTFENDGYVNSSDIKTIINVIFNNFDDINNQFKSYQPNENDGILIKTDKNGWFGYDNIYDIKLYYFKDRFRDWWGPEYYGVFIQQ